MKVVLINNKMPYKKHPDDAGYDLFTPCEFILKPFTTKCIGLGLAIQVPKGYACLIVPRSSTTLQGIVMQPSIIDCGYTGEIHLIVTNCSRQTYKIKKDKRLGSLALFKISNEPLEEVKELPQTDRGSKGLGSTGK